MHREETTAGLRPKHPNLSVVNFDTGRAKATAHEQATLREIGRRLAAMQDAQFAGLYDPHRDYDCPLYFVPDDTLLSELAARLGIRDENGLYGGAVPFDFVATKSITHHRLDQGAGAPAGWRDDFPARVATVVLAGFSAFSPSDAYRAGIRILRSGGQVRIKLARDRGGCGQTVVADPTALKIVVDNLDDAEIQQCGLVLEENLDPVMTRSVGSVKAGGLSISYVGMQNLTPNNEGTLVYGGSDLLVVRGSFGDLLMHDLDDPSRLAVKQAMAYDAAAHAVFPAMMASRRNYDVAYGRDVMGKWRSGVLEQSWRLGGATTAELAAFEAFRFDPTLRLVRAVSTERYGGDGDVPPTAAVYFSGIDPDVGPITKYATVSNECA